MRIECVSVWKSLGNLKSDMGNLRIFLDSGLKELIKSILDEVHTPSKLVAFTQSLILIFVNSYTISFHASKKSWGSWKDQVKDLEVLRFVKGQNLESGKVVLGGTTSGLTLPTLAFPWRTKSLGFESG
jgi:hypothetical protein